ncbi:MAG: two-component regulator propeller domain-containing protein [Bacteroidales bacterium]|nr:two-component regulator propeller domain-containing protein [Bacteroidales bacterium]
MWNSLPGISSLRSIAPFLLLMAYISNPKRLPAQTEDDISFDRLSFQYESSVKNLSQNTIYAILQDNYGYMWFGTWDGLNRYDGYSYTVFPGDQIGGQTVQALLEDDAGDLWIGTDNGLTLFNRRSGIMKTFRHTAEDPSGIIHNDITDLLQDRDGKIWIGTRQGLCYYDRTTGTFTSFLHLPQDNTPLRSNTILDMKYDGSHVLWLGTRMGLIRFDVRTYAVTRYYHILGNKSSIPDNVVKEILVEKPGYLWAGTPNGLCRIDMQKDSLRYFFHDPADPSSLSDNRISSLQKDARGMIWIGTENGLNRWDPVSDELTRFLNQSYNTRSIGNNRILSLYEDRKSTLWIGTFNGINKIEPFTGAFLLYRKYPDDPNSLSSNYVISIAEDPSQRVWIATDNGLNILDRKTGEFTHLRHQEGNNNSLSSNFLRVVYFDRTGTCWIGTQNNGVDRFIPASNTFIHYRYHPKDTNCISSNEILSILEDSRGFIWIGTTEAGLNRLEPVRNTVKVYKYDPGEPGSISSNKIWSVFEDSDHDLWVGTGNGLNKYDPHNETFYAYINDPADTSSIGAQQVFSVFQDSRGIFWLGTKGGGLNRFDKQTGSFRKYNTGHGLPSNVVYGCLEDEEGNLWISTNWGLSRFNPKTGSFMNYDVKDGIQSNEFNLGAQYRNRKGELYFGGMNGFNVFHPATITVNPAAPQTVITSFSVFDKTLPGEFHDGDTIRLSARENFFTIEFSALDFTNPSKNKYRYRFHNYDNMWTTVSAENRVASYTKVSPGTYRFTVFGSNNSGIWDEKGASLVVIITPIWYQTWLFRILCVLLFIGGASHFIYRRIHIIHRRHEIEKKMLDLEKQLFDTELQALRLQMNPHFIFNTLNSIQSFILENEPDTAVDYLGKFSQLMRSILINSRESFIPVQDELRALRNYMDLEKLRFNDKFDYRIEVDPAVEEEFMEVPTMIIQPYVENSIIHGLLHKQGKGLIRIKISLEGEHLLWIVEDNGIGRRRAIEIGKESGLRRESRGMLITRERLEVLNKMNLEHFSVQVIDLTDEKGDAAGTRVEVRISGKGME